MHREDAIRFAGALQAGGRSISPLPTRPTTSSTPPGLAELWLAVPFAGLLGIEHRRDEVLPGSDDTRRYGDTAVTFYNAAILNPPDVHP